MFLPAVHPVADGEKKSTSLEGHSPGTFLARGTGKQGSLIGKKYQCHHMPVFFPGATSLLFVSLFAYVKLELERPGEKKQILFFPISNSAKDNVSRNAES